MMQQGKSHIWPVVLAIILTAAIVAGGMYLWQRNAKPGEIVQPKKEQNQVDFLRRLKSGDTVAGMTLQSIEPFKKYPGATLNLRWEENLEMKFKGETTVTGNYLYYDGNQMNLCDLFFEIIDPYSLAKIPFGNERFCIANVEAAKKLLRSPKSGTATIVIDEYHIIIYPADGLPDAKLVKKIEE